MPQRMATVLVAALLLSAGFAGSAVADDPVLPLAFSTNTFNPYNGNENLGYVSLDDGDVVIQAFKAEASGQVTDVWIMGGYAPPDGTQLSLTLTDGSAWPNPGVDMGTTSTVSLGSPARYVDFDASAQSWNVQRGQLYVLTLKVEQSSWWVSGFANPATEKLVVQHSLDYLPTEQSNLTLNAQVVVSGVDTDAPTIDISVSPSRPDGRHGWYISYPTGHIVCDDPTTPVDSSCGDWTPQHDGIAGVGWNVADLVGHTTYKSHAVKIDTTPPSLTWVHSEDPNGQGWYDDPVVVSAKCADQTSGIIRCRGRSKADRTQRVYGMARDEAGHTTFAVTRVRVDVDPPQVDIHGLHRDATVDHLQSLKCRADDGTGKSASGVASCRLRVHRIHDHTYIARAVARDNAGNHSTQRVRFLLR